MAKVPFGTTITADNSLAHTRSALAWAVGTKWPTVELQQGSSRNRFLVVSKRDRDKGARLAAIERRTSGALTVWLDNYAKFPSKGTEAARAWRVFDNPVTAIKATFRAFREHQV